MLLVLALKVKSLFLALALSPQSMLKSQLHPSVIRWRLTRDILLKILSAIDDMAK